MSKDNFGIGDQIIITSKDYSEKIVLLVTEHCFEIKDKEDTSEYRQKYTRRFELEPTLYDLVADLVKYGSSEDGIVKQPWVNIG